MFNPTPISFCKSNLPGADSIDLDGIQSENIFLMIESRLVTKLVENKRHTIYIYIYIDKNKEALTLLFM